MQERKFIVTETAQSWEESVTICADFGGHLASFASNDEIEDVLIDLPIETLWIGLNDIESPGTFEWSDGSVNHWKDNYPYSNLFTNDNESNDAVMRGDGCASFTSNDAIMSYELIFSYG